MQIFQFCFQFEIFPLSAEKKICVTKTSNPLLNLSSGASVLLLMCYANCLRAELKNKKRKTSRIDSKNPR